MIAKVANMLRFSGGTRGSQHRRSAGGRRSERRYLHISDGLQANRWYDAAADTNDNAKHWANATELSARTLNSPSVRRTLRSRARYECHNGPYALGLCDTYAGDVIGTGPKIQIDTKPFGGSADLDATIEREWGYWSDETNLPSMLRVAMTSRVQSGEVFIQSADAPHLSTVPLGLHLIEADRIRDERVIEPGDYERDGIRYGEHGQPIAYRLAPHIGDYDSVGTASKGEWLPASTIVHLFRATRPGQIRGIPEISAALPILAELRRYRHSVLAAAETAARIAMTLETNFSPEPEAAHPDDPFDVIELERRAALVLPHGYKLNGFSPTQPQQNHVEIVRSYVIEAGRCLGMPAHIALGDASQYNYSSGRLDIQTYGLRIAAERRDLESVLLARVFEAFIAKLSMQNLEVGPAIADAGRRLVRSFIWRGRGHVDPVKEAQAASIRLAQGTTTLAELCALEGHDYETVLTQRARELKRIKELGIEHSLGTTASQKTSRSTTDDDETEASREEAEAQA